MADVLTSTPDLSTLLAAVQARAVLLWLLCARWDGLDPNLAASSPGWASILTSHPPRMHSTPTLAAPILPPGPQAASLTGALEDPTDHPI